MVINRVRELRRKYNYSQKQLADLTGVSRQTIISIENGHYQPSLELSFKISRVFSLSIEDIFKYMG